MNSSPLFTKLIEAPLIMKGFVSGEIKCNYELYLTEYLNASSWMAGHYSLPFISPESESHGECDAYAGEYGLDYKLIASKTALQSQSIFSMQVDKYANGIVAFGPSKKSGKMIVTRLAQSLRGKTIDELLEIQTTSYKYQGIENDIKEYMDTICTQKNLLLYFPYRFQFQTKGELNDDVHTIVKAIQKDFAVSLTYRAQYYPELYTYFVFLYDYYFILCQWEEEHLILLEIIPVESSQTFMHLAITYCYEWHEKYDVLSSGTK